MKNINLNTCKTNNINTQLQISTDVTVNLSERLGVNQLTEPSASLSTKNGGCN